MGTAENREGRCVGDYEGHYRENQDEHPGATDTAENDYRKIASNQNSIRIPPQKELAVIPPLP